MVDQSLHEAGITDETVIFHPGSQNAVPFKFEKHMGTWEAKECETGKCLRQRIHGPVEIEYIKWQVVPDFLTLGDVILLLELGKEFSIGFRSFEPERATRTMERLVEKMEGAIEQMADRQRGEDMSLMERMYWSEKANHTRAVRSIVQNHYLPLFTGEAQGKPN